MDVIQHVTSWPSDSCWLVTQLHTLRHTKPGRDLPTVEKFVANLSQLVYTAWDSWVTCIVRGLVKHGSRERHEDNDICLVGKEQSF